MTAIKPSTADIMTARRIAAEIIIRWGPRYEPLFDRLDREVRMRRAEEVKEERLHKIANEEHIYARVSCELNDR